MKFEIRGEPRTLGNRGSSRRLRRTGRVPAIVYGGGKEPRAISVEHDGLAHQMAHEAFYTSILTLKIGSKAHQVVVKGVERHPARPQIMHLDFQRVREDVEITLTVPIHFTGEAEAKGVKDQGGVVDHLMTDWVEVHGDRAFADDAAIVAGFATFRGRSVAVVGHQKGRDTRERIRRNFGQPRPEGYRKALRVMKLAEKFGRPVLTLIDTAGAYPGIGAEERGQAEAIARSTDRCLSLGVPLVAVVIGEGGSGGAVAIATANRVLMLEHAIYTVASPEAAATILWRDSGKAIDAATGMKITAQDLKMLGVIDVVITEPVGGAHRDPAMIFRRTSDAIAKALSDFAGMSPEAIRRQRHEKFLAIGREA